MRIRTIKPEFFSHEELCELPPLVRLTFAGLFCAADREGRFEWRPKRLKLQILPWEKCDFEAILNQLAQCGFIQKYEHGGKVYGCIPTFSNHQRVNIREAKSNIPEPPKQCNARARQCNAHATHVQDSGEREGEREKEREMEGEYICPPAGGSFSLENDQNLKPAKTANMPAGFVLIAKAYRPKSEPVFTDKLKRLWRAANPSDEDAALVAKFVEAWRKDKKAESTKYCCREIQTCLSKFGTQLSSAEAWRDKTKTDPQDAGYYDDTETEGW